MSAEVVIRAEALTKRYGATLAVDHIDIAVNAGEIVGILGPNGSGKTTTILMLLGLTEPTSGNAEVAGYDPLRAPLEVKRRVGYLPDQVGFYDNLSARDNLAYTGRLAGLSRPEIDERFAAAIDRVGLADVGRARVGTFSQGMRQRLGLAEILMKRPSVAILDEPTTALDPHSTQEFLDMIRRLKGPGIAERLAAIPGIVRVQPLGHGPDTQRYRVDCASDLRAGIARHLAAEIELIGLHFAAPSLNEVYTRYFEEARDAAE